MASVAFSLASTLGAAGCSMEQDGVDWPPTVSQQLENPTPLVVALEGSTVLVEGRELPILGGEVKLGTYEGDVVELDGLNLSFDTMFVTGENPQLDGFELRHVRVSLAHPVVAPVEWTSRGDAGFASLKVELLLDWSVVAPNGTEAPLATQHLKDVQIELDVYTTTDGTLTAVLDGAKPGIFWSWAGLANMGDLQFDVRAVRTMPQPVIR